LRGTETWQTYRYDSRAATIRKKKERMIRRPRCALRSPLCLAPDGVHASRSSGNPGNNLVSPPVLAVRLRIEQRKPTSNPRTAYHNASTAILASTVKRQTAAPMTSACFWPSPISVCWNGGFCSGAEHRLGSLVRIVHQVSSGSMVERTGRWPCRQPHHRKLLPVFRLSKPYLDQPSVLDQPFDLEHQSFRPLRPTNLTLSQF